MFTYGPKSRQSPAAQHFGEPPSPNNTTDLRSRPNPSFPSRRVAHKEPPSGPSTWSRKTNTASLKLKEDVFDLPSSDEDDNRLLAKVRGSKPTSNVPSAKVKPKSSAPGVFDVPDSDDDSRQARHVDKQRRLATNARKLPTKLAREDTKIEKTAFPSGLGKRKVAPQQPKQPTASTAKLISQIDKLSSKTKTKTISTIPNHHRVQETSSARIQEPAQSVITKLPHSTRPSKVSTGAHTKSPSPRLKPAKDISYTPTPQSLGSHNNSRPNAKKAVFDISDSDQSENLHASQPLPHPKYPTSSTAKAVRPIKNAYRPREQKADAVPRVNGTHNHLSAAEQASQHSLNLPHRVLNARVAKSAENATKSGLTRRESKTTSRNGIGKLSSAPAQLVSMLEDTSMARLVPQSHHPPSDFGLPKPIHEEPVSAQPGFSRRENRSGVKVADEVAPTRLATKQISVFAGVHIPQKSRGKNNSLNGFSNRRSGAAQVPKKPSESSSASDSHMSSPASPSPVPSTKIANDQTPSPPRRSFSPMYTPTQATLAPRPSSLWKQLLEPSSVKLTASSSSVPGNKTSGIQQDSILRSISDLTGMTKEITRQPVRLIDNLKKPTGLASGSMDMDEESDSDEDSSENSDEESVISAMDIDQPTESQASRAPTSQTLKMTYGQQRSHLAVQSNDVMDMLEEMDDPLLPAQNTEPGSFDLESDTEDCADGYPQGAQHLRAAGSNKRLLEDLEALASGIRGEGTSVTMGARRSNLMELIERFHSPDVVDAFLDHGLDRKLLETFAQPSDTIFEFLSTCCMSLIIARTSQLAVLRGISNARNGYLKVVLRLLDIETELKTLVQKRSFNMSGVAKNKVIRVEKQVLESSLWSVTGLSHLSPRLVSLRMIELLMTQRYKLGGGVDPVFDENVLLLFLRLLGQRPEVADDDIQSSMIMSILKASSTGATLHRGVWTNTVLEAVRTHVEPLFGSQEARFQKMRQLAVSLIVDLTNNNTKACLLLGTVALVSPLLNLIIYNFGRIDGTSPGTDGYASAEGELILTLVAMINLSDLSIEAREATLSSSSLELLVRIFETRRSTTEATSEESVRANIPPGWLAVLLAMLLQQDKIRQRIGNLLSGGPQKVNEAVLEFALVNQKAATVTGDDDIAGISKRLNSFVERLGIQMAKS